MKPINKKETLEDLLTLAKRNELNATELMLILQAAMITRDNEFKDLSAMEMNMELAVSTVSMPKSRKYGNLTRDQFIASKLAPYAKRMRVPMDNFIAEHLPKVEEIEE